MSDILTYNLDQNTDALTGQDKARLSQSSQPADYQTVAHYREQALRMFKSLELPAVIYKGTTHAKRKL